jgi:hypothetical protein
MALNQMRRLPAANQVSAGTTSTFQVPLGPTYRSLNLRYTSGGSDANEATQASDIERIRLKVNGISRIDVSGARWHSLVKYYGFSIADGVFPIPFSRKYLRTTAGEDNTSLGTGNLQSLTLEVDIASGATTPTLALDGEQIPVVRDLGSMIQVLENTFTAGASGTFEVSTLPRSNGALKALHMHSSAITAAELSLDSLNMFDADLVTARAIYAQMGRVPQSSVQHIEPTYLDRLADLWPLDKVQDYRAKLTMSGSGSVVFVQETLGVPNVTN